jgi:hypothetical protein
MREGDRVRVVSEGDKDLGAVGRLSCVDNMALFYVDVAGELLGPFTRTELEPVDEQ